MAGCTVLRCALIALVLCSIWGHCEMSVYPGLRRRPLQQAMEPQYEIPSDFLAQLMGDNARRRLQQQFEQQLELIKYKMQRQRQLLQRERYRQRQQELQVLAESEDDYSDNLNNQHYDQYDNAEADVAYGSPLDSEPNAGMHMPMPMPMPMQPMNFANYNHNNVQRQRDRIPFAVGPDDSRFFDNAEDPSGELDSRALDDYEEYPPVERTATAASASTDAQAAANGNASKLSAANAKPVDVPKLLDGATANFHRIKPQTAAAAAVAGVNLPQVAAAIPTPAAPLAQPPQHDISALIEKLQKQSKTPSMLDMVNIEPNEQIVLRQHLGMSSDMGVYVVALIAGVSAAVTVGLLALAVTWFQNRTKAAADVDYPAYGVTGPNRDVSPSGDRKLAQSAQMYHYQHQKQQIIAMENCQATDGSCGLSDVESDDDNEEGDYTVYECPGLAPTGEMEVKNPLFLDETPATPVTTATAGSNNNITQATPQQPATIKKGTIKPNIHLMSAAAVDEKAKRKPKK